MKIYFRLLSFAKPIQKFAIPYIIFTLFHIVFGLVNFTILIPIFNLLFDVQHEEKLNLITSLPDFSFSIEYFTNTFYYFMHVSVVNYGKMGALYFVSAILFGSVFLSNFFRYLSQIVLEDLRIHTLLNLRKTVFNRVIELHLGFFSNERKGDIMSKISNDVQTVQASITSSLVTFFKEPMTIIIYFIALFKLSVPLTVFTIFFIPVTGLIIARIVKKLKLIVNDASVSMGVMLSILDESLTALRVVKAFNATTYVQNKFQRENENFSNINRKMVKKNELASPVSELLGVTVVVGILIYGGKIVLSNESDLNPGEFIAYIAIFSQVLRPAKSITSSFSSLMNGIVSGERVLNLIDTKNQIVNKPNAQKITSFQNEIEFKNISFAYDENLVLSDISFKIQKGKTIALVGPSGGGKSTISDLIPRFYDPTQGQILIDGIDIKDCTMESLREQMGIVNQESLLFNDTIFSNIAFGIENATKEQVIHAAKVANAHNFIIETKDGYDTIIGDRGTKLSGGQKQRLNIARAVLRNPPILILDEATSALDTESEKLVQEALFRLMENRTTLVIAHRLSTIQNADEILVIEKGRVVEKGTHNELIKNQNGVYFKLNSTQNN
jgi:subfamily B ATP-binding cassette protein MsbA